MKIETQAKKWFSYKKTYIYIYTRFFIYAYIKKLLFIHPVNLKQFKVINKNCQPEQSPDKYITILGFSFIYSTVVF